MKVNVSAIKCYQRNPLEWYYRYHLRRVPRRATASYFVTGRWWHEVMQNFYATSDAFATAEFAVELRERLAAELQEYPEGVLESDKFIDETTRIIALLHALPNRFIPENTLAVEQPIETKLPSTDHTLIGRPDRVIQMKNKFWHLQFKTVSDRTPMKLFVETRERDLHELAYAYLISGKYCTPDQYGGVYLQVIRKLSHKAIIERPHEAFVQELVPIHWSQVTTAICDIADIADDMAQIASGNLRLIQNRDADVNRFGNVLSSYYDVYAGRVDIHDNVLFMDAPDPYSDTEAED